MNKLSVARRAAVVRGLMDGASIRAIARMTQTDKDTVSRILVEVGEFAAAYQDVILRDLPCVRIEADEIWSFVGAKEANKTHAGQGDLWTYTALCADTKLMVSWFVGSRTADNTRAFMDDLASRLGNRVQLSTDGFNQYRAAVEHSFGADVDYGTIVKTFAGGDEKVRGRYSPSAVVTRVEVTEVMGKPVRKLISTSYVERTNLGLRMNNRRFTRLTNAFSKKAENHAHSVALHFMAQNFCRAHGTLTKNAKGYKTTPAMAAGLTDHVWTVEEMLEKLDGTFRLYANAA